MALAIELFRAHALSAGLAAKVAGLSYSDFIDRLAELRIPVADYDPVELDREIGLLEAKDRR